MRVLVVGGAGSGKSAYAEQLACSLGNTRTYVATMANAGVEARKRIARHRAQRANKGFVTVESPCGLPSRAPNPRLAGGVVLLEDVGNLVANALFDKNGRMGDPHTLCDQLEQEVLALCDAFRHAVVVGNEVGSEGTPPDEATRAWVRTMGALHNRIASRFDVVAEVALGIPCAVKGALP